MIGFGQVQDIEFYLPSAMDDRPIPLAYEDRFPLVVFTGFTNNFFNTNYNTDYPDSIYGTAFNGGQTMSGNKLYNINNQLEYSLVELPGWFSTEVNITYSNSLPYSVNTVRTMDTRYDTVLYDFNGQRSKIIRHKIELGGFNFYSKVEFVYTNNQVTEFHHLDINNNLLQTDYIQYDANGNISQIVVAQNHILKYHYNINSRLTSVVYWENNNMIDTIAQYAYNNGKLTEVNYFEYNFSNIYTDAGRVEIYYDMYGRISNEKTFGTVNFPAISPKEDLYYFYTRDLYIKPLFS